MTDTTPLTDSQKLDRLLAIAEKLVSGQSAASAERPAWMTPPLDVTQVVVDGQTINRDGSRWENNLQGVAERVVYGYFSAEKDPALHERLLALFGPSYQEWYDARDPWALYKVDISEMVERGAVNWLTFSWNMKPYSRFVQ